MEDFGNASAKLAELNIEVKEAGLERIATTNKELDPKHIPTFMKLIDVLEDNDDVQKVYHNCEFDESMLEE